MSGTAGRPKCLAFVAFAAALSLAPSVSSQSQRSTYATLGGHVVVEGEVLVKYRDQRATTRNSAMRAGADVVETFARSGIRRLQSRRKRTVDMLEQLRRDPDVEYAEPNYVLYALSQPNDPGFANLWGLLNTGSNPVGGNGVPGADIDATTAWNTTTGSRSAVVGIIDSGVDYTHPDLAANMWSAPTPFQVTIGGQTITCQAGTHGFNAITRTCDPMEDQQHGTHVAGTIGAVGNNGIGVAGVNWTANMMALKFLNASGQGSTSDAIAAIEFAIQAKAAFASSGAANIRVLSNSWGGGGYSTALLNAINAANAADMLFVAAAGNSHSNNDALPSYPASYPAANMIAVASSDSSDQLSSFSNYGATSVHLAAPGTAILSTVPGGYAALSGTSMAAPHVSGAAMLALAACDLTTASLKALVLDTVDEVAALLTVTSTGGRLNVARMIDGCEYPRVTGLAVNSDLASPQAPNTTITFTAAASGGEAPHEYQWATYDGVAWTTVTSWSTSPTFEWTPSTASTAYRVAARARSAWNTGNREMATVVPYTVMPIVTSLAVSSDVSSPQPVGTAITWSATAAGGESPYQYQWALDNGSSWTTLTEWSTTNTFTWTPVTASSAYRIAARARSAWNTGTREKATVVPYTVLPKVTSLTMAADRVSPQPPNSTITFTAAAGGGQAPYQYEFAVYNGSTWTTLQAWSSSPTFAWTPSVGSTAYQVAARARSAWNAGTREMATTRAFTIMPVVTSLSVSPGVAAPQAVGASVLWTASASGGQEPYQYEFAVYNGSVWTTVQPWSSSPTFAWTPSSANVGYQVAGRARSAWNSGAREIATVVPFAVLPKITGLTLTSDVSAPRAVGQTVTWTGVASGGQAPYQYQWAIYDGSTWTTVKDWSTSPVFSWTPTSANAAYQVAVRARGTWNTGPREMATTRPFPIQ